MDCKDACQSAMLNFELEVRKHPPQAPPTSNWDHGKKIHHDPHKQTEMDSRTRSAAQILSVLRYSPKIAAVTKDRGGARSLTPKTDPLVTSAHGRSHAALAAL